MALTAEGIVKRAEERLQREAEDRTENQSRMRRQFLRYLDSHTYRFRYMGAIEIGDRIYQFPMIEITERPLALVVQLKCRNQLCHRAYDVALFTDIRDHLFWMPCANCHWPITLRDTSIVYPNNTFPVIEVKRGMEKHDGHTIRYENWLRFVIAGLEEQIRQNPDHKESILWDEDDQLPEVRMRTSIESDEETLDAISKEAAKTWGFGKAEIPKQFSK